MKILDDVLGVGGAGLVSYGCWEIYRPAGLIVLGAMLLTAGMLRARAGAQPRVVSK